MRPLISVVIPLYNKEKWIERCLRSVLAQTYDNLQIIIVNDGSTDRSLDVVECIEDERIQIIDQANGGVSSARNRGIEESQGEYIAFLDADDEWKAEHLHVLLEGFKRFDNAILVCDDLLEYDAGTQKTKKRRVPFDMDDGKKKSIGYVVIENYLRTLRDDFFVLSASSVLIRTSVIKKHKLLFYESMTHGEDVNYWIRLNRYGNFVFSDYAGAIYHHIDAQSAMHKKTETAQLVPDYFHGLNLQMYNKDAQQNILTFLEHEYYKKAFQNRTLRSKKEEFSGIIGSIRLRPLSRMIYVFIRYCPESIFEFLMKIKKYKENRNVSTDQMSA